MPYDLQLFTRNLIGATTPTSSEEDRSDQKIRVEWNLSDLDKFVVAALLRSRTATIYDPALPPSGKVLMFNEAIHLTRGICNDFARTLEDRKELLSKRNELYEDGSSLIQEWQETVKKIQGNVLNPHRGTIGEYLPFLISSWSFAK